MPRLPLEGLRVADLTLVWAGPFATALLADMGAEVIKVESVQRFDSQSRGHVPDFERTRRHSPDVHPDARPYDVSPNFNNTGRNKLCATMDLLRPEGRDAFLRLIERSDVFVENNSRAVIERLGLGWEVIRAVNPRIVMCSLAAFGSTGPYRHYRAYGTSMEAMVGHTLLRGYPDVEPVHSTAVFAADANGGATAAFAILAALYQRRRSGHGQLIDMSQAENMTHALSQSFMDYSMNRRLQSTRGNRHPSRAPQGVYRCAGDDSWIAVSVGSDEEFRGLCDVMGRPELAFDTRYRDGLSRRKHQDDLDADINAWSRDRDSYQAFHALQAACVPSAPVLNVAQVAADPHLGARENWQTMSHPMAGQHDYLRPIIGRFSKTPLGLRKRASMLGEDNEHVYRDILGYSQAEYDWFVENGHAGTSFLRFDASGRMQR